VELLKILRFPYNISATAGSSDFFGAQLGFAKTHHKITRRRKDGRGPGLGELLKIWGFPFNVYTMAEASDFKFGTQLGFAKAHHKTTLHINMIFSIRCWYRKSGRGLGLAKLPYIWGSPLISLQRPHCPLALAELLVMMSYSLSTCIKRIWMNELLRFLLLSVNLWLIKLASDESDL